MPSISMPPPHPPGWGGREGGREIEREVFRMSVLENDAAKGKS